MLGFSGLTSSTTASPHYINPQTGVLTALKMIFIFGLPRIDRPMDSTTQMENVTPDNVRKFLLPRYSEPIQRMGFNPVEVPDTFDFFLSGVVNSFGILEMVSSIEEEFRIRLDFAALDAEQITILGPLSQYVAENAKAE